MSTTQNARAAIDRKLDQWEKYLERLEANLIESKDQAIEKLEEAKTKVKGAIDSAKAEIDKIPDLANEKKEQLLKSLDELKQKLEGKTEEAKEKFGEQKEEIKAALKNFEEKAKANIDASYHKAVDEIGKAGSSLHAHLDALEHKYEAELKKKTEEFDEKKNDFNEKVKKWKAFIHEKRNEGMERLDVFEKEFMDGIQGVNSSFKNLFK